MTGAFGAAATARLLRVMLRVADLDVALRFYREALGMSLLHRGDYEDARFTRVLVGCDAGQAALELTHNWDHAPNRHGDAFGYLALDVPDLVAACERVRAFGCRVTREPGPMKHGRNVIAFVEDPDGYRLELIERSSHYD